MRGILGEIERWRSEAKRVGLATVVYAEGSAPRREGARLAVSEAGDMAGSVSGGCVENDVVLHTVEAIRSGEPQLLRYAISDETSWEVGLACGGTIEVWVEPLPEPAVGPLGDQPSRVQAELESAVQEERLVAAATAIGGAGRAGAKMLVWPDGRMDGSLGEGALDARVAADLTAVLDRPWAQAREYSVAGQAVRIFGEVFSPAPHVVIFGAVHIAMALTTIAKAMGYRVTVADPRARFANAERFPQADRILVEWPQQAVEQVDIGPSTSCVILTHDPKIDEPALLSLVGKDAGYIGAIGSAKTHGQRFERLEAQGLAPDRLADLYAPIGLDLGAVTPEEIALAIMAEIVAVRRGRRGGFMRERRGMR